MAEDKKGISTATAILIAGALIGAGLFFGLRSAATPPPAAAPPSSATTAAPRQPVAASPPAATTGVAPSPAASSARPETVAAQARVALDEQRDTLVKACVDPLFAKGAERRKVKLTMNFTFDPRGKQITQGLAEDRQTSLAGLSTCLSEKLQPISVPPPGANTYVEVPWELP